jgi:hypothetical protein
VIARVDPHADHLPRIPTVRQRLREGRIHFEFWRLHGVLRLGRRNLLQHALAERKAGEADEKGRTNQKTTHTLHTCSPHLPGTNFWTRLP